MDQQQLQGQQPMTLAQQQASGVPAQLAAQAQNGLMRPIPNPMAGGFSPQAMGYMGNNPALAMQMGQAMGPQATHTMSPAMTHPGAGGMLPQQMAQVRMMLVALHMGSRSTSGSNRLVRPEHVVSSSEHAGHARHAKAQFFQHYAWQHRLARVH
jgi:hypothetical protein